MARVATRASGIGKMDCQGPRREDVCTTRVQEHSSIDDKLGKCRLTPSAKYSVNAIDPKYAAVNGKRGPDVKCWTGGLCVSGVVDLSARGCGGTTLR